MKLPLYELKDEVFDFLEKGIKVHPRVLKIL